MSSITKPITVNGFVNLGTALRTAGYVGGGVPTMLLLYNASAATLVYVHFTDQSTSAGLTGIEGIPISSAAFPAHAFLELHAGQMAGLPDLNNIWLFTGASIPVTVAVRGA